MALQAVLRIQHAFSVIATLMFTAYLFPKQAVVRNWEEFDFIIVGAGTAGSVLADRLSERPDFRVLVIEAGGDPPIQSLVPNLFNYLPRTEYDWNITSTPDAFTPKAMELTNGRVLGGSSSLNYMMYVRGCPADFDTWAQITQDDSWCYWNVLQYFIKSERLESPEILNSPFGIFHGTKGFLGVNRENRKETAKYLAAFKEAGNDIVLDINGWNTIGYTLPLYTIADGIRQTTAYTNLGNNKDRKNLYVLKNTFVVEILFDANNNAIGVKAITADNTELTVFARKEVIVSAGALNTPKVLMLSGIGPKQHLQSLDINVRSDLPVGMNLQSHFLIQLAIKMERSNAPLQPQNPYQFPVPVVVGYGSLNISQVCADYQAFNFLFPNDSEAPYQLCAFNFRLEESQCQKVLQAGKGRNILYVCLNQLRPNLRGRVKLRSKNPHDPPIVNLMAYSDVRDIDIMAASLEDFAKVVHTSYFKSVDAEIVDLNITSCSGLPFGSRQYWRCYVLHASSTMFHYVGTSAMGTVLDSRLRVRGVRRLRVADTSVMPVITSGNTNAPAIMIGEKASDIIKADHPF